MKNQEINAVKEVVDRMRAPYENIGEPVTLVIGCGGAGNNLVNYFHQLHVEGITTIGINTDERHLAEIESDKKVLIGKTITRGGGAEGQKEVGKESAKLAESYLKDIVRDSDIVFLIAGLGGGTGLGTTPVVARIAKEQGAVVIGIGIMPFIAEVSRRKQASKGFEELERIAESAILLDNNKLLNIAPDLSADESLNIMNRMISQVIINTRKTMIQTIMATKSLDVAEIIGEFPTTAIEESEPTSEKLDGIVLPAPISANMMNDKPQESQFNGNLKNHSSDIFNTPSVRKRT